MYRRYTDVFTALSVTKRAWIVDLWTALYSVVGFPSEVRHLPFNPSEVRHLHVGPILSLTIFVSIVFNVRERERAVKYLSEWFFPWRHSREVTIVFWFADDICIRRRYNTRQNGLCSLLLSQTVFLWIVKLCALLSTNNRPNGNYIDILWLVQTYDQYVHRILDIEFLFGTTFFIIYLC